MDETNSVPLSYAVPTGVRRHSPFAIAGFTVALLAAAVPAMMGFLIWRARRPGGGGGIMVGLSLVYFALPATATALSIVALARGSRRPFAVAALVLGLAATTAALWMNGRMF